jgi:hypothetical protein
MLIKYWHSILDEPKESLEWHQNDVNDELQELAESKGFIHWWSELSDVAYTYTRGKWSGHDLKRPINFWLFSFGLIYMFPKYTLRWTLYYSVGKKFDKKLKITEVRNPRKSEKLKVIAERYGIDPIEFEKEIKKRMKYWILLK